MILESPRIVRQSLKALEVAFNSKISPQQNNGNTLSILSKLFRERRRVFLDLAQFLFSKVLKHPVIINTDLENLFLLGWDLASLHIFLTPHDQESCIILRHAERSL